MTSASEQTSASKPQFSEGDSSPKIMNSSNDASPQQQPDNPSQHGYRYASNKPTVEDDIAKVKSMLKGQSDELSKAQARIAKLEAAVSRSCIALRVKGENAIADNIYKSTL